MKLSKYIDKKEVYCAIGDHIWLQSLHRWR